jgi:hypothetical protein
MAVEQVFKNREYVTWINSIECITPRILFERCVNQWFGSLERQCLDSVDDFIFKITQLCQDATKYILILENVEDLLPNVPASFLDTLCRLSEIVHVI